MLIWYLNWDASWTITYLSVTKIWEFRENYKNKFKSPWRQKKKKRLLTADAKPIPEGRAQLSIFSSRPMAWAPEFAQLRETRATLSHDWTRPSATEERYIRLHILSENLLYHFPLVSTSPSTTTTFPPITHSLPIPLYLLKHSFSIFHSLACFILFSLTFNCNNGCCCYSQPCRFREAL